MPKFSRKRGCGKQAAAKKGYKKSIKTANRSKDIDQIQDELKLYNNQNTVHIPFTKDVIELPVDVDKPGSGQYYCRYCAKYFISDGVLKEHERTKPHKKRIRLICEEQYTQEDAEAAAGMAKRIKT